MATSTYTECPPEEIAQKYNYSYDASNVQIDLYAIISLDLLPQIQLSFAGYPVHLFPDILPPDAVSIFIIMKVIVQIHGFVRLTIHP